MHKDGKIIKQEIFSVGIWNEMKFTLKDLEAIASSFLSLRDVIKVPLKLGHDENQPLTDGLPAIGWVRSVELNKETGKLEAEFEVISEPVIRAIEMKMYRTVSIELDIGVTYKDKHFAFVLTGVALLGAELPAVNNLNDLGKFDRSVFTKKETLHFNFKQGDNQVDEKELKALMERVEKTEADIKLSKEDNIKVQAENVNLKKEIDKRDEDDKKRLFTSAKTSIEDSLETLVKANKILPSVREKFTKEITEDNIESKSVALDMMFESMMEMSKEVFDKQEQGRVKDPESKTEATPDAQLHVLTKKLQMENSKLTYRQAFENVIQANSEVAREWLNTDGYKAAA